MIIILLGLLFGVNAQWWGSRPQGRNHEVFTEIYLDPAERYVTGSRFESSEDRGAEGADCNCQGICGYGRGSSGHLIFGNNKKSGAHGCHWCGHGQYDPSYGDHDKIVYCYNHVCDPGYVSICEQSKHFSIWAESYHPTHRACTCAKAAGQWTQVPGNYADEEVTTSTTQYEEYAHSVTNTNTVAIETSATYGVEIEGIGASSTLTMTEEFSDAVENSWTTGSSTTKTVSLHCGNDNKDTAWQYVIYMYDVLCASGDATKRFLAKANGGCAISAFLSGSGTTCTTSVSEPPCCGPGANPIGTNDRKFCEDDYESWTGQCDGWSSRVRFTSIEDGRINCHINECPDETDRSLQAHLSTCGQTCANNGYANTFVPSHVFDAPNMLRCKDLGWATEWFQKSYCKQISSTRHVVALMRRDCAYLVYSTSSVEFDDAYKSAEEYATSGGEDALDLVPIYYNNWQGVCDGHMNIGQEVENCKCDDECHKWGDCCNTCAEANSYAVESITEREWQHLGPLRSSLTEEEFKIERDAFDEIFDYEWQKTTNLGCGYGGQCTSLESKLNIGFNGDYSSKDGATVDECKATCEASPECAGFNYQKTGEGKCWFRRSVTCNIVSNNDRDCYSIQRPSEIQYHVASSQMTLPNARSYCQNRGGFLVKPRDEADTDSIRALLPSGDVRAWLGIYQQHDMTWLRDSGESVGWTNWKSGEGNDRLGANAGAAMVWQSGFSGEWYDMSKNDGRLHYVVCAQPNSVLDLQVPMQCENIYDGYKYHPINYGVYGRTVTQDAHECARRCESAPDCIGSSWWSDGGCHLSTYGAHLVADSHVTSSRCSEINVLDRYDHIFQGCIHGSNIILHTGKSVEECSVLCDVMDDCWAFEYGVNYGGSGQYKAGDCQLQSAASDSDCDGAHYNLDLYIKRAHNICPSGFDAISNNLDGEGKKWASDKSSRTVQECANICKDHYGCTGFEYNEKDGRCGTYTGGSKNVQRDEGRLYAASEWRSCLAANGRRRKL